MSTSVPIRRSSPCPNRLFYGERLTVLTDPEGLAQAGSLGRLSWVDVGGSPTPGGGSWYNESEIEKVREVVAWLRERLPEGATIGVVTPFAAQKDRIAHALAEIKARIGTVHTFQGGECDAMVLSLVAGPEMRKGSVSWLERSANLWNVAITRARAHLVVIGDRDFWRGRAGIVGELERETSGELGFRGPPDAGLDTTGDALHRVLEQRFPTSFDRDATVDGYYCDFRIDCPANGDGHGPVDSVAIILDRGAGRIDPARHLRLQFERCDRLRAAGMSAVYRVPAWQIHTEPHRVISAFNAVAGLHAESWDNSDRTEGHSDRAESSTHLC
jgi:hypothetical protein